MQPKQLPLRSVRTLLVWLVLACLLPGVIGAGFLFVHEYQDGREQLEKDTLQTSRALAQAVDSELSKARFAAQFLAHSSHLATQDLAAFHRQASALLQESAIGANIVLSDKTGQQIVNTLRPFGEPLPRHGNAEQLRRVFASGQPAISDVYIGGITGRPVISIDVPVLSRGEVVYDLSVGIFPEQFGNILRSQRLPADWVAGVFDRAGTIAARTHAPEQFVGQKGIPELIERLRGAPEGTVEALTREGIPAHIIYSRAPLSNWSVAIAIPRRGLETELMHTVRFLALGISLLFSVGVALAWFIGGRIAGSIRALTAPAIALGAGQAVEPPSLYITEAEEVAKALGRAEQLLTQRSQALSEANATLQERDSRLSAIVGYSPSVLSLKHPDGRYALANPNLQQIHHRTEEEIIGRSDFDLYPEETARTFRANDELVLHTLSRHSVEEIVPVDGQPRTFMSHIFPVLDAAGAARFICRISLDITVRKQADLALQHYRDHLEEMVAERTALLSHAEAEQRRLNRAQRLLSDCNMVVLRARNEGQLLDDLCHLIVKTGGYLMAWVGVAEQDAAKSVRPVAQSGDEDGYLDSVRISWDGEQDIGCGPTGTAIRTGATQIVQEVLDDPEMAPWREYALKRGYQSSVALPLLSGYEVLGVLMLYSAEPKAFTLNEVILLEELASNVAYGLQSLAAHSELERYQQQLEKLVAERTQEIAALNADLLSKAVDADSANRAKSTFLATMSHEIRTPLNAVVGLTGLLAESPLDRRQRDYADKIQLSAQALRALIDDILDFSRIEAGALQLEQAPFSLNNVLRTTAAVVSVGTCGKAIEVLFDVAPEIPDALLGDALRLQQILLNLTSNAVKFTDTGEIVISVRCLARDAGQVTLELAVRDTGIGIPPEQLGRIFEAFTQTDASTSRLYGGSGLGLAISARLADLMGGQIAVDSTVHQGSEFRFTLTLALADSAPLVTAEESLGALNVLVVDDHPLSRDILTRTCAAFGWQAKALDSGAAGLAELRRSAAAGHGYDLMLLDWRMPGMDGLAMLRQANAAPDIALPLVVLMACTFEVEQAIAASDDLQLDGIAAKPLTPASLREAVTRAYSGELIGSLPVLGKSDRRLAGMRLLVAEDNDLNQQVIEQILIRAGAEVVLAANGRAAVEALRAPGEPFDAVLMDIQMPVLDGYGATRVIREELGLVDLPIIAVTAFARPEDREKSRSAGMLGHMVKPLNVDDLLDVLRVERRGAPRPARPSAAVPAAAAVELPGLDVAAALKAFAGDEKKYAELLRKFAVRHAAEVAEARCLFRAGDLSGAARLVHDLRGVAGFLQATTLARLAAATEGALVDGKAEAVAHLFDELELALRTLGESIDLLDALQAGA